MIKLSLDDDEILFYNSLKEEKMVNKIKKKEYYKKAVYGLLSIVDIMKKDSTTIPNLQPFALAKGREILEIVAAEFPCHSTLLEDIIALG